MRWGRRLRGLVCLSAALACLLSGAEPARAGSTSSPSISGSASGTPAPTFGTVPAPVRGSLTLRDGSGERARPFTVLINGVQRLSNSTVLYFSIGTPTGYQVSSYMPYKLPLSLPVTAYVLDSAIRGRIQCDCFGDFRLVEPLHHKIYGAAIGTDGNQIASSAGADSVGEQSGVFYTYYQVLPALPADVKSVDVLFGNGEVVPGVPVGSGALTPAVPAGKPVPLGSGWPAVDPAVADHSIDPARSIRSYGSLTSTKDKSVTVREKGERTTVDLAADVLFRVDSSDLSAAATSRLRQAAERINAGTGGTVTVTGHTDSTGSTAHNRKLSKARAQSVATALQPLVTVPGVTWPVAGRGESTPVASNSTKAGRKANRRVTVSFVAKG